MNCATVQIWRYKLQICNVTGDITNINYENSVEMNDKRSLTCQRCRHVNDEPDVFQTHQPTSLLITYPSTAATLLYSNESPTRMSKSKHFIFIVLQNKLDTYKYSTRSISTLLKPTIIHRETIIQNKMQFILMCL